MFAYVVTSAYLGLIVLVYFKWVKPMHEGRARATDSLRNLYGEDAEIR